MPPPTRERLAEELARKTRGRSIGSRPPRVLIAKGVQTPSQGRSHKFPPPPRGRETGGGRGGTQAESADNLRTRSFSLCSSECPGKTGAPTPSRATAAPLSYATGRVDRGVPASDWAVGRGSGSARGRYSGGSFEYRSRVLPVIHSLSCSSTSLPPPSFAFPVLPCEWKGREWREGEREGERERERERGRVEGSFVAGGPSQSSGEEGIEQGTRRHRLPPTIPDDHYH